PVAQRSGGGPEGKRRFGERKRNRGRLRRKLQRQRGQRELRQPGGRLRCPTTEPMLRLCPLARRTRRRTRRCSTGSRKSFGERRRGRGSKRKYPPAPLLLLPGVVALLLVVLTSVAGAAETVPLRVWTGRVSAV
ncbi:unnamed protein product, partial [Ectocarpus fasciculatus]